MSSTFRLCRYALCLVAVFLFVGARGRLVAATLGPCEELCTDTTPCDTECLYDLDSEETCGDWGTCGDAPACSDVCGTSVACDTLCSGGDGSDCGGYNGGKANNECYGTCGDGVCQMHEESCSSCSADCGACTGECQAGGCSTDGDCTALSGGVCNDHCCAYPPPPPPPECEEYGGSCSAQSDCCQETPEMCESLNGSSPFCMDTGYGGFTPAPLHSH